MTTTNVDREREAGIRQGIGLLRDRLSSLEKITAELREARDHVNKAIADAEQWTEDLTKVVGALEKLTDVDLNRRRHTP